eukprot:scaffold160594_cov17-Tisochrysis_lutea.AAC.1
MKDLMSNASTPHTILLGVLGACCAEHAWNQFRQPGLSLQRAAMLAQKPHVHSSAQYAHKFSATRHAIENKNTPYSQILEPGASKSPLA